MLAFFDPLIQLNFSMSSIYEIEFQNLAGKPHSMADFKSKVCLIVNVASKCGFTSQYEGLESLYKKYNEKGFSILGMPCNQFGGQEPGNAEEIQEFCKLNFGVSFDLGARIDVNGADRHPLYQYLTDKVNGYGGNIKWNFEKFLIGRDGRIIQRFGSRAKPEGGKLEAAVEIALA